MSALAAGVMAWLAAAHPRGTDNSPTDAARPMPATTPGPPGEPTTLPSAPIALAPFSTAPSTALAAAGTIPFMKELVVFVIDTPELSIDMLLLTIETMLLIGERCGLRAFQVSPSHDVGDEPC